MPAAHQKIFTGLAAANYAMLGLEYFVAVIIAEFAAEQSAVFTSGDLYVLHVNLIV